MRPIDTDRPRGKWIDEADKYEASFGMHDYKCSNCNHYADDHIGGHEWYTMYKPNYCPYCGADMKESEGKYELYSFWIKNRNRKAIS